MKPIDTTYNGYRFRSRLEARWAVFFDELDIAYQYEKQGYDLGGIWYLPDFWLPNCNLWVEVKAKAATPEEHEKARLLREQSGHKCLDRARRTILCRRPLASQGGLLSGFVLRIRSAAEHGVLRVPKMSQSVPTP